MTSWKETFTAVSKRAKAPRSAFGADATGAASPAVQAAAVQAKGVSTGWAALGIGLAAWAGYEYAVRRVTRGAVA